MNTFPDIDFDRVRKLQDDIGALLRKRFMDRKPFVPGDFPSTPDELAIWEQFTASENLDVLTAINSPLHAYNEYSIVLWKNALAECQARATYAAHELTAVH